MKMRDIIMFCMLYISITYQNKYSSQTQLDQGEEQIQKPVHTKEELQWLVNPYIKENLAEIKKFFPNLSSKNEYELNDLQNPEIFQKDLFNSFDQLIEDSKTKYISYILIIFTHLNLKNFDPLKNLIYKEHCDAQKFHDLKPNKPTEMSTQINYKKYHEFKQLMMEWYNFYKTLIEKLSPKIKREEDQQDQNNQENQNDQEELTKIIQEVLLKYDETITKFEQFYKFIIIEVQKMNCGVGNMLEFYSLTTRFAYLIQNNEEKVKTKPVQQIYQQIFALKEHFFEEIFDPIIHRIYFFYFWGNLMSRLKFLVSQQKEVNWIFIEKNIFILDYFTNVVNYSVQLIESMDTKIQDQYDRLVIKMMGLEQLLKIGDSKLTNKKMRTLPEFIRKNISNKVFAWGYNKHNCGYPVSETQTGNFPLALSEKDSTEILKTISGYSESLILAKNGQVFQFGLDCFLKNNKPSPSQISEIPVEVIDCDIDKTHAVFLGKNETVYVIENKQIKEFKIQGAVKVACGVNFSVALIQNPNQSQDIAIWVNKTFNFSEEICCGENPEKSPKVIETLSHLLQKEKSKVKKLQVVEESLAILLENGKLFSWGSNLTGNLGITRLITDNMDYWEEIPLEPTKFAKIQQKIKDFAMSDNILVVLTEKGEVFYSGLDKDFTLQKINFLPNMKIKAIGAFHNNFVLISEDDRIFAREPLEDEQLQKYWGDVNLYEIDQNYFGKKKIAYFGGKYDNISALINQILNLKFVIRFLMNQLIKKSNLKKNFFEYKN